MTRHKLVLVFLTLCVASLLPMTVTAHGNGYGYGFSDDGDVRHLGWMLVDGEDTSMSSMEDMDDLEDLKHEYGSEFLYIRDTNDRWVIRDRALMRRAKEAHRSLKGAASEVSVMARARAAEALAGMHSYRGQAKLARKMANLQRKIARAEARGESTKELEREQKRLDRELDRMNDDDKDTAESEREEREYNQRQDQANERLSKAVKHVKHEIRDILNEAKSRHLAERVKD